MLTILPTVCARVHKAMAKMNAYAKKSWMMTGVRLTDYEPSRTPAGYPLGVNKWQPKKYAMNRFIFEADAGTSLDAEVLPGGNLRIIWNGHIYNRYYEDHVFTDPRFAKGKVVTPAQMYAAVKRFVDAANYRLGKNLSAKKLQGKNNVVGKSTSTKRGKNGAGSVHQMGRKKANLSRNRTSAPGLSRKRSRN